MTKDGLAVGATSLVADMWSENLQKNREESSKAELTPFPASGRPKAALLASLRASRCGAAKVKRCDRQRKEKTMSLSKECQAYHLTLGGWKEGSFEGDAIGGRKKVPTPPDRVLTILCYNELASAYSKPSFYDRIDWESEDKAAIERLKKRFGAKPDWFGYKEQGK
jgi:hypothetical protein